MCGLASACPCRGKCSTEQIDKFVCWSMEWAAAGTWPLLNFDGSPFQSGSLWEARAGTPITYRGRRIRWLCIEFRADWAQFSEGLGMAKTNQKYPCFQCSCLKRNMFGPMASPRWTHESYMSALSKCRIELHLTRDDAARIWNLLTFDFRKNGVHGRCLSASVTVFDEAAQRDIKLAKWDRLDLGGSVLDVHCSIQELELQGAHIVIMLWRKHPEVSLSGHSFLMQSPGFRHEFLCIDNLHTLDLGVAARLSGEIMVRALKTGVLGTEPTAPGMLRGCVELSRRLRAWYKTQKICDDERGSKLNRITLKMLQYTKSSSTGHLKCKGFESRRAFPFACKLAKQLPPTRSHIRLRKAAVSLLKAQKLMDTSGRYIDHVRLGHLLEKCAIYSRRAGVYLLPKFHLMRHMHEVARRAGNPKEFSAYGDESHNHFIVKACQSCHSGDFTARVLAKEAMRSKGRAAPVA